MPYSSGTFSRVHDFTTDRDAGIKIQASRMDAEMDGIATGLSTAILKDGTQTTTAVVPFAFGISIVDNKAITLGTNSDITIQYDETTNDSLEIAAAVEGAALGIVLKSDQGDDNADQHKLSIADGGTLTLASKISGSFVTYLTHTPNSTVASSTLAVAGNLTVGGNLTLGSGAELSEAELEMLDGITAGTVAASKAVVVDANKDAASFRNITLTGELDAGSLDVSGDIDVDGTSNLDVVDIDGAVDMASTLTVAGVVDITDTTDSTDATGDTGALRVEGGVSIAKKLFVGTDADIDGTLEADAMTLNGSNITTTATLSTGISNGNVLVATSGVADNDFLKVDGTSIEGRSASEVLSDIGGQASLTFGISNTNAVKIDSASVADDEFARFTANGLESRSAAETLSDIGASPVAGSSSIVTTGALDSGSITSGFGAIDNGTSGIRTNTFTAETSVVPSANDGATLGTASLGFADLFLADGGIIKFGDDQDVTVTHDPDDGLIFKSSATGDNNPFLLTLQTGETDIAEDDVLGKIAFQAPDEGTDTDSRLLAAAIQARSEGDFAADSNATSLDFMTGESEDATTKMTLTSDTKLSLGVASGGDAAAGGGMHIHNGSAGSVSANSNGDELVIESSGRGGISILTPDANESNILFGSPSDNLGGFITYKQSNTTMEIGTSISNGLVKVNTGDGSLHTTFEADGDVNINNGNLVLGTSGKGIDFSANSNLSGMSNELLEHYEEGTYTPTLTPSTGGSIGVNSSFDKAAYTKIGRVVHVTGSIVSASPSSATGAVGVSLPFTIVNLGDEAGDFAASATISSLASVNVAELTAFASEGGTTLDLHLGDNINPQADLAQEFSGNETIHIGITYFTS